jgi:hypothetical protein
MTMISGRGPLREVKERAGAQIFDAGRDQWATVVWTPPREWHVVATLEDGREVAYDPGEVHEFRYLDTGADGPEAEPATASGSPDPGEGSTVDSNVSAFGPTNGSPSPGLRLLGGNVPDLAGELREFERTVGITASQNRHPTAARPTRQALLDQLDAIQHGLARLYRLVAELPE